MKQPDSFLTNTVVTAGRTLGAAKNNPGDNSGTGADKESYNDNAYGLLSIVESYRETGNSDTDETLIDSDVRDALEEMVGKKVSGIADWASGTTYTVPTLVMYKGFQFFAFNTTGNLAKPPLENPLYWIKSPSADNLLDMFFEGSPQDGGMNDIANRGSGSYRQDSLIGTYRLGENGDDFYDFYRIALDGTVVTGDANLEAIFDVGGGNEYFKLDLYAPDVVGTRTLIDMSSRHIAPISVGGDNDVLGEVLADRVQGHFHEITTKTGSINGDLSAGDRLSSITGTVSGGFYIANNVVEDPITDGVNGTPRTGATTRPKEFTVGSSYIIVMIPA